MATYGKAKPIRESLKEYGRGVAGGLLFSFPLLYTMEVWWQGFIASPSSLLVLLAVTFLLLIGYNRFAGLHPDSTWQEVVIDSVEEMGLGLVISFCVLLVLNRIQPWQMAIDEIMGKTIIEAMAVSIGISVGTAQLGARLETQPGAGKGNDNGMDEENGKEKKNESDDEAVSIYGHEKLSLAVLALCGSILVGGNVAPTEEIVVIAIEASPWHILAMCMLSLLLCALVLFFSDFRGSRVKRPEGLAYHIAFDTCLCYSMALGASAFVLWFFGRFQNMSLWNGMAMVIVLGVLSSIGASAGRLLIK